MTPWTFLAPKLGGKGKGVMVGGGPPRIAVFVVAAAFSAWARRWRERPEMLAWALAVVLSVRIFLETVMYSYYIWPALAVALVVAARGSRRRFGIAVVLAIVLTVVTQWHMSWVRWWPIVVVGMTGVLLSASRPQALVALPKSQGRARVTAPRPPGGDHQTGDEQRCLRAGPQAGSGAGPLRSGQGERQDTGQAERATRRGPRLQRARSGLPVVDARVTQCDF